jgi:hypothetical protein
MAMTRRYWVLSLVAFVLVVAATGFAFHLNTPDDTAIGDRVRAVTSEAASPAPPVGAAPEADIGNPTLLRIPAIRMSAAVVPTTVEPNGAVIVPEDITTVGWYAPGPRPGDATGSTVIVGHRDGVVQGHGALYSLGALNLGDHVVITTSQGTVIRYRVVAREVLSKRAFAKAATDYFATTGPPRLTLITCGGVYSKADGGYQANVVVTAVPDTGA